MDDTNKRKRPESMIQEPTDSKRHYADSTQAQPQTSSAEEEWHSQFPAPTLMPDAFPRQRALMILSMRIASLLIIDVRREDYLGGSIRGSLNVPAQGFWWNRGMLYELAFKADVEWVIFVCDDSVGRAPRCAAWFLEHVRNTAGDANMHVSVLEGGMKEWVRGGPQFCQLMDGFVEGHWVDMFGREKKEKEAQAVAGQDSAMS